MRTIGMIGGMSWESTAVYYRLLNETVREKQGGLHSAKSLLFSFDFAEIEVLQHQGLWDEATQRMIEAAQSLEKGGADFFIICTNTMHKMADAVSAAVNIPLLHIADPTARAIQAQGMARVALLGTRYTMEQDFYRGRLERKFGLQVITPTAEQRDVIHTIIYDELCLGQIKPESKSAYIEIINALIAQGAQAVIFGCTEIGLLLSAEDVAVPVFDTTVIHAQAAVDVALDIVEVVPER